MTAAALSSRTKIFYFSNNIFLNKTNVKGHSKNTKHSVQILYYFSVRAPPVVFIFLCLQWASKRGKRASVTMSWLALHSPHSRPALQPAQTWATAPDVTGAFLLCHRLGFGSCSPGVHDSPFQYMLLYGGSISANSSLLFERQTSPTIWHHQFIYLKAPCWKGTRKFVYFCFVLSRLED